MLICWIQLESFNSCIQKFSYSFNWNDSNSLFNSVLFNWNYDQILSLYINVHNSQTKRTFNIFQNLTCKSQYVIYSMECILCKIQFAGKPKTPFNWRLNNHTKYFNNLKAIPAWNHFKINGHNFMKHAKFTLIEELGELVKTP